MPAKQIDPELLKNLYWKKEMSLSAIAKQLHVAGSTVYVHMVKANISRRPPSGKQSPPPSSREVLYDLYHVKRMSAERIAKMLDSTSMKVYSWLKKFGIKTRTRREARLVQVKPTSMKKLNDFEIGYIAALLDGEGSLNFKECKSRYNSESCFQVSLRIHNTSLDFLRKAESIIGGKIYVQTKPKGGRKPVYNLALYRICDVVALLKQISEHLVVKHEIAFRLLKAYREREECE
jgi:hypothetical protein